MVTRTSHLLGCKRREVEEIGCQGNVASLIERWGMIVPLSASFVFCLGCCVTTWVFLAIRHALVSVHEQLSTEDLICEKVCSYDKMYNIIVILKRCVACRYVACEELRCLFAIRLPLG